MIGSLIWMVAIVILSLVGWRAVRILDEGFENIRR